MNLLKLAQKKLQSISFPAKRHTKATIQDAVSINPVYGYDNVLGETDLLLQNIGQNRDFLLTLEYDTAVASALDNRSDFVCSTPFEFESDNEDLEKFIKDEVGSKAYELAKSIETCVPRGFSVVGIEYCKNDNGVYVINRHLLMPIKNYQVRQSGQWQGIIEGVQKDLDELQYVVTVRNPTYENLMGEPLLAKLFKSAEFRKNTANFWLKWLERFGFPMLIGETENDAILIDPDTGLEISAIQNLSNNLGKLYSAKTIAINQGQAITSIEPSSNGDHFEKAYKVFTDEVNKMVLGSSGTVDSENTTYASGQTAENTLDQKITADLRLVVSGLQKVVNNVIKINNRYGAVNFGDATCKVSVKTNEDIKLDLATRDETLTRAGARFSKKYFQKLYDLDDDDLDESQPFAAQLANKLTTEQQNVGDLADKGIEKAGQPIDPELIKLAIETADNQAELEANILELLGEQNKIFLESTELTLWAANLLGYGHITETVDKMGE